MFCLKGSVRRKKQSGSVPVYLNVYDLTPMNAYTYWFGFGVYHSGVEVNGVEYAFGAHESSSTGIFELTPKTCPGFTFRKSILVGKTDLAAKEVSVFMNKLGEEYQGNKYHLITKNCNHFCNEVCLQLTQKSIPLWVNRLARVGFICQCVLPPRLNEAKVRRVGEGELSESEKKKKKLRSRSQSSSSSSKTPDNHRSHNRAKSTGNHPSSSSSSSSSSGSKQKNQRPKGQDQKSPSVSVKT